MSPLAKAIERLSRRHDKWRVFSDFVEMAAISISNAVDIAQREPREARYMQIVKAYEPDEVAEFPKMLGELTLALERDQRDHLGAVFGELELANKWVGQFFTPQEVADLMGRMTFADFGGLADIIKERGFITLQEPAVGAGAMVIAAAKAFRDLGYNYQRQLHVTAIDVDDRAAHMAYVQLSLLGIPAKIVHGNTLTLEVRGVWYTPAHVFGFWNAKLRRLESAQDKLAHRPDVAPHHDERPKHLGEQLTLI